MFHFQNMAKIATLWSVFKPKAASLTTLFLLFYLWLRVIFFFLWMFWPWNENIFSREFTLKKKESMGGCVWTTFPFNTETFLHKNTTKLTNFIKCSWYFLFKNVTRGYLLFSQIHHLFKNHSSWKCTFLHRIHRPKVTVLSRISFLSQGLCLKFKLKILCEIMTDFPC